MAEASARPVKIVLTLNSYQEGFAHVVGDGLSHNLLIGMCEMFDENAVGPKEIVRLIRLLAGFGKIKVAVVSTHDPGKPEAVLEPPAVAKPDRITLLMQKRAVMATMTAKGGRQEMLFNAVAEVQQREFDAQSVVKLVTQMAGYADIPVDEIQFGDDDWPWTNALSEIKLGEAAVS
jgi:hypothetical protein